LDGRRAGRFEIPDPSKERHTLALVRFDGQRELRHQVTTDDSDDERSIRFAPGRTTTEPRVKNKLLQ
jgi:hypothetical protein